MAHGIYINEVATSLITPVRSETITVAVGTAPVHKAAERSINEPVIAYRNAEAVKRLGYDEDFDKYTLSEVMKSFFYLYNISPVIFINVLDPAKHSELVEKEIAAGKALFEGDIDATTFKVTSGENIPAVTFEKDIDFEVREDEVEDIDLEETETVTTLHILNGDKVYDNKIKVFYRLQREALGGREYTTEITLSNALLYELPSDTLIESVRVESGGLFDLIDLVADEDYQITAAENGIEFTILDESKIVNQKVKVSYNEVKPEKVTAADIINGIEIVDSIHGKYNLVPTILIAPKYSLDSSVRGALVSKAKSVSKVFPAMALADLDPANESYQAAIESKNKIAADTNLIICYPKVKSGGQEYYLSSHIAALMAQVDNEHDGIPYVSPSNHALQIEAAVVKSGEIYFDRDEANLLNDNGIVTAFSFNGWRAYGNYTSIGESGDVKDKFISIRRMFQYITNYIATTYISQLDMPLTRRLVDTVINSANIYLNGLTNRGALLGGRLELSEENTVTDLMNGILRLQLYMTPPSPTQALIFTLEYDTSYVESLLA